MRVESSLSSISAIESVECQLPGLEGDRGADLERDSDGLDIVEEAKWL